MASTHQHSKEVSAVDAAIEVDYVHITADKLSLEDLTKKVGTQDSLLLNMGCLCSLVTIALSLLIVIFRLGILTRSRGHRIVLWHN